MSKLIDQVGYRHNPRIETKISSDIESMLDWIWYHMTDHESLSIFAFVMQFNRANFGVGSSCTRLLFQSFLMKQINDGHYTREFNLAFNKLSQ